MSLNSSRVLSTGGRGGGREVINQSVQHRKCCLHLNYFQTCSHLILFAECVQQQAEGCDIESYAELPTFFSFIIVDMWANLLFTYL